MFVVHYFYRNNSLVIVLQCCQMDSLKCLPNFELIWLWIISKKRLQADGKSKGRNISHISIWTQTLQATISDVVLSVTWKLWCYASVSCCLSVETCGCFRKRRKLTEFSSAQNNKQLSVWQSSSCTVVISILLSSCPFLSYSSTPIHTFTTVVMFTCSGLIMRNVVELIKVDNY